MRRKEREGKRERQGQWKECRNAERRKGTLKDFKEKREEEKRKNEDWRAGGRNGDNEEKVFLRVPWRWGCSNVTVATEPTTRESTQH